MLITSAAGGPGSLLVQAALNARAFVIGAAGGPDKVEQVRRLGASVAVDYDQDGWASSVQAALSDGSSDGREVSIVLDAIGGERGRAALELLGMDGRFLVHGFSSGEPTPLSGSDLLERGITASAAIGGRLIRRPGGLRSLEGAALAALATGQLVPLLTRFPLAEAAVAHAALENRETVGKVVLIPA